MKFARAHAGADAAILCPCIECNNIIMHSQRNVERHLNCNGMLMTYTRWYYHGEPIADSEGAAGDGDAGDGAYDSDDDEELDGNNYDDVPDMVENLRQAGNKGPDKPNVYAKLLEEAKVLLHEGCTTYTRLTFIIKFLYVKSYTQTTNRAFNLFLGVLRTALPQVKFPKSYAEAKSVLSEVRLGYELIDVCKFDCAIF